MRRYILIPLVVAALLLGVASASARCLDFGDDCRVSVPTRTLAPLWTATPTVTATTLSELPPPPATQAPNGYPGQVPTSALPTVTVTSTPTDTPLPPCTLDWTLPYSAQAERDLGRCLGVLLNGGYPPADVCPPASSFWSAYFCTWFTR